MTLTKINLISIILLFLTNLTIATSGRKYLTYKGVQIVSIFNNLLLLIFCSYNWSYYILQYATETFSLTLNSNNWTNINYEINFKINSLSFLFIFLVNIIGFATNIYILNYLKHEERAEEFTLLINWFIFSMIFLVMGDNFFTIILGWELIGLTSFLLINFWKFKITTLSCSFKAFSFNKVSDMFLMISFCSLWNAYKVNNIDTLLTVISLNNVNNGSLLLFSSLCLLISCSIKSAQFLGHLWLPDSMEAPVPASSLIHSATLVSAGIFLILKFQTLFVYSDLMGFIFFLGSLTACFGGVIAASQSDMKKLLAYSTISHCGFIVASISLNNFIVTIVYLYLHGLFKALTFFCAGSIIKNNGSQDMRLMGMNKDQVFNTTALIIASINLGGLPFTFGYLYKQLFLMYLSTSQFNLISYGFNIVGMLCSVVYVFKIIYYSCFDYRKGFMQTVTLYLQTYKTSLKSSSLNFTFVKLFAFLTIYLFAVLFFFVTKYFILKNYIYFFHLSETVISDYKFLNNYFFLKSQLLTVFYVLFITVVLVLITVNWRTNYFFLDKVSLILYSIGFLNAMILIGGVIGKIIFLLI